MKKNYTYTLLASILLINVSCDNSDAAPDPEDVETSVTIGNTENLSILSLNDELVLTATNQDVVALEIDIDEDQSNDLTIMSHKIDDQTQLILIKSTSDFQLAHAQELFTITNLAFNYLSLAEVGTEIKKDDLDWSYSNQELLVVYRNKNTYSTPNPSPLDIDAYLPIYDGERLGWLTFSISTDISLESISVKEFVYTELDQ